MDGAYRELYRGQCNCSYWHGAFGGIYLPHLRNAVYRHLIAAENLLYQAIGKTGSWVEATIDDYNFDSLPEMRLANDKLLALLAPMQGGMLYEFTAVPVPAGAWLFGGALLAAAGWRHVKSDGASS